MAIQLNDRDHLIFKLIDEHEVLLEKHISWFIAGDDKPVLIRDRLRKLFYLDYLLCHRHGSKLPWWTTPTKPLVYMLSPMARTLSAAGEAQDDIFENDFQRHHLEVANLRMLYLIAQKNGLVTDLQWQTFKRAKKEVTSLDARVTFSALGTTHKVGLVNNPDCDSLLADKLNSALAAEDIDTVLLISRDEVAQKALQDLIATTGSLSQHTIFATHQDLYREGIAGSSWQTASGKADVAYIGAMTQPIAV
jgi:hypothetical protein